MTQWSQQFSDPPNRFDRVYRVDEDDGSHLDPDSSSHDRRITVQYLPDEARTIVSENKSPDIPFRYSLNPYRGCVHGCSYCYARNSHEYLGFNAGNDFDSKILVKHQAPRLFEEFLATEDWQPEKIVFSGVTDCYQPAEREFQLTRQCLQVALRYRHPVAIITKNALITRDLDILRSMADSRLVHVSISITTLRYELSGMMEPRTSTPEARLRAIKTLSDASIPVRVMVAPVIPGLNDSEIPAILKAAAEAGASSASYQLLRLPLSVEPVFRSWLSRLPTALAEKVENQIRRTRGGLMNSTQWHQRMTGEGELAEQIQRVFHVFAGRLGLNQKLPELDSSGFARPIMPGQQRKLF
ncbi:MAG: PA0069 family radical SAM protein [Planctomyces sp.]